MNVTVIRTFRVPAGKVPDVVRSISSLAPPRSAASTGPMEAVPSAVPEAFWKVACTVALSSCPSKPPSQPSSV